MPLNTNCTQALVSSDTGPDIIFLRSPGHTNCGLVSGSAKKPKVIINSVSIGSSTVLFVSKGAGHRITACQSSCTLGCHWSDHEPGGGAKDKGLTYGVGTVKYFFEVFFLHGR